MESPGVDLDEVAARLRDGVGRGYKVSELLSSLALQHGLGTIQLIKCLRSAFGLSLSQAAPVGGWSPDGAGEITHERLDQFIGDAIAAVQESPRSKAPDAEPGAAADGGA